MYFVNVILIKIYRVQPLRSLNPNSKTLNENPNAKPKINPKNNNI